MLLSRPTKEDIQYDKPGPIVVLREGHFHFGFMGFLRSQFQPIMAPPVNLYGPNFGPLLPPKCTLWTTFFILIGSDGPRLSQIKPHFPLIASNGPDGQNCPLPDAHDGPKLQRVV